MTVSLVGAGPGDPELLTLKAARLLASAEVVVYDRLAEPALVLADPGAELVDVGKRRGGSGGQGAINDLLVELGRRGRRVVRLKGGDPFVFGRGGEEALALAAAGIAFEVVPGVSSAFSGPAAAGVPVTHRGVAGSVTVVTGHRREGEDTDWTALARLARSGGTLVVLMGVERRGEIADALLAAGLDPATPVAAVASATTAAQSAARTTLADLGATPLEAPAVLVVGAVAALDVLARSPETHPPAERVRR